MTDLCIVDVNGGMKELKFSPKKTYDKRIVIKWWKMVTLVNNPVLIVERIEKRVREETKSKSKGAIVVSVNVPDQLQCTRIYMITLSELKNSLSAYNKK